MRTKGLPHSQVCHLWANKSQPHGQGFNVWFDGATIYSYGTHFPIATHITAPDGKPAILFTTLSYSMSTAKHISYTRYAIGNGRRVFRSPFIREHLREGLSLKDLAINTIAVDAREWRTSLENASRKQSAQHILSEIRNAKRQRTNILRMAAAFKVKRSVRKSWLAWDVAALQRCAKRLKHFRRLERDPAYRDAHETKADKARIQREEAAVRRNAEKARLAKLEAAEKIEAWRNGESVMVGYEFPKMIRIKGERVETSGGAQVMLREARAAYWQVMRLWRTEQGGDCAIGVNGFTINNVNADGVRAGCHFFDWSEITRFGKLLSAAT